MDDYAALLEKTSIPQPAYQRYAVIALFSELRSAPSRLGPDSEHGRRAIDQCLRSSSPHVVEQAVRELCLLVIDEKLDLNEGFDGLLSALEVASAASIPLFVKALGFLTRRAFLRNLRSFCFATSENHPFVKIISSGAGVHDELVKEVVVFLGSCKEKGMECICDFLKPFLHFTILPESFSVPASYHFISNLCYAVASFCCSFPSDAFPILRQLISSLKFLPIKSREEFTRSIHFVECVAEGYMLFLRQLVASELRSVVMVKYLGVELAEGIVYLLTRSKGLYGYTDWASNVLKRLFEVQKDLKLSYMSELRSLQTSLLVILLQSEHEHQLIPLLKLLVFLLDWKFECEHVTSHKESILDEELLFLFPIINLVSSASKSLKAVATNFLVVVEKKLMISLRTTVDTLTPQMRPIVPSSLGSIVFRSYQNLIIQDSHKVVPPLLFIIHSPETIVEALRNDRNIAASLLNKYCLHLINKKKSSSLLVMEKTIFSDAEFPLILGCISGALILNHSLRDVAIDQLITVSSMDPKLGATHLLVVLFLCNVLPRKGVDDHNILTKLLSMLPSLALHTTMIPLVIQTIKPMVKKDMNPVLQSTGIRLLCKAWECNDRAFGSLIEVLHPDALKKFGLEKSVCLSLAASVRDVCKINPDKGVDIILTVSACIESEDPIVRTLGFQSLSYLCEADVIDFYTAWDVISKHLIDYTADPILTQSACKLLRWGALDAEAYAAKFSNVVRILWNVVTTYNNSHSAAWAITRASAFESLTYYEVSLLENELNDFKKRILDLLYLETNAEVLREMEQLLSKIILHEHNTRQRLVKEKIVARTKTEKLLDVLPQVLFPSGWHGAGKLAGAALICLPHIRMDVSPHKKTPTVIHANYKDAATDITTSINLSRNIFVALFSLQSWKVFVRHWMNAFTTAFDATLSYNRADKSCPGTEILKSLMQISEEAIPRSAENAVLGVGALCMVLPPSLYAVKSKALEFLSMQLSQYEHEHMQWSSALSLGLLSSCLDITEHNQKIEIIDGLLQVLCCCKSTLVKGACAVALGFSCQGLLRRLEASDKSASEDDKIKSQERTILPKIVWTLLNMISGINFKSNIIGECLDMFPLAKDAIHVPISLEIKLYPSGNFDEDIWGSAGLVIGLGYSIYALYRSGSLDAVHKIKEWIISCIVHSVEISDQSVEDPIQHFSVGACYVLPAIVSFSRKVEIMTNIEMNSLLDLLTNLIRKLLSGKMSNSLVQFLLTTSCLGAGEVLSFIVTEGVQQLDANRVKDLLNMFRKCYVNPYHSIVQLGGMVGFANALGAGVGMLHYGRLYTSLTVDKRHQESSKFFNPSLISLVGEDYITSIVQEIFLVAQNSGDIQMQQNASWIASFLRNCWQKKEHVSVDDKETIQNNFPENSYVLQLSEWLSNLTAHETGSSQVPTAVTVLKCLTQAPRLPLVDWGLIIRKCMRYEEEETCLTQLDSANHSGMLREHCLLFAIAHAKHFDALRCFLDELSDISRFRTLSLNLQLSFLLHMSDLMRTFSSSNFDKMLTDVSEFFRYDRLHSQLTSEEKRQLRMSCWSGLHDCLIDATTDSKSIKKCVEILFSLLSYRECSFGSGTTALQSVEEWCAAIKCLGRFSNEWLLEFLTIPSTDLRKEDPLFTDMLKKMAAKAKLVRIGSLPLAELSSVKSSILRVPSDDAWDVLVEVTAALHNAQGKAKRQWIVDTIQICCVSPYPSTGMTFLGLLCGAFCKYAPLLMLHKSAVLTDLPVTLTALLSEPTWLAVAEATAISLWTATDRVGRWINGCDRSSDAALIEECKDEQSLLVLRAMHSACVCLKDYLPVGKQLSLCNMDIM